MNASAVIMPRDVLIRPTGILHVSPAFEVLLPSFDKPLRRVAEDLLRLPRDLILMAGSASNYLAGKFIEEAFGAVDFTAPTPIYAALWTTTLDDTSTGSSGTEAAYTSYARVSKTNNTTTWPTATGTTTRVKSNGVAFGFPTSTGSTATVTYAAIVDASSAGNSLCWFSTTSTVINSGDTPNIASSAVVLTQD